LDYYSNPDKSAIISEFKKGGMYEQFEID